MLRSPSSHWVMNAINFHPERQTVMVKVKHYNFPNDIINAHDHFEDFQCWSLHRERSWDHQITDPTWTHLAVRFRGDTNKHRTEFYSTLLWLSIDQWPLRHLTIHLIDRQTVTSTSVDGRRWGNKFVGDLHTILFSWLVSQLEIWCDRWPCPRKYRWLITTSKIYVYEFLNTQ